MWILFFLVGAFFLWVSTDFFKSGQIVELLMTLLIAGVFIYISMKLRQRKMKKKAKKAKSFIKNNASDPADTDHSCSAATVIDKAEVIDESETESRLSTPEYTRPHYTFAIEYNDGEAENYGSRFTIKKIDTRSDVTIMRTKDYCVLDVETTGLSRYQDHIIEIAIIQVVNNEISDTFSSLINPKVHIPQSASKINGIYDEDVSEAPEFEAVADRVARMLGDGVVISHNITFDLSFIQRELEPLGYKNQLSYIDTCTYGRRLLPTLPDHKLQTLLQYFEIDPGSAHRAYDDALATYNLFNSLRDEFSRREKEEQRQRKEAREREKKERREKYAKSPLLEKSFCFTGEFSVSREEMIENVISVGALPREQVSGKTTYLVVGDVSDLPEWAIERKKGKAEELQQAGKPIQIIDEDMFFDLLQNARAALDSSTALL